MDLSDLDDICNNLRKYLSVLDEVEALDEDEVDIYAAENELDDANEELARLDNDLDDAKNRLDDLRSNNYNDGDESECDSSDDEIDDLESEISSLEDEIIEAEEKVDELETKISDLENDMYFIDTWVKNKDEALEVVVSAIQDALQDIESILDDNSGSSYEIKITDSIVDEAESRIARY